MAGDKIQVVVHQSDESYGKFAENFVKKFVFGKIVKYATFNIPLKIASKFAKMTVVKEVETIDGTVVVPVAEKEVAEIGEKGLFTLNMLLYT